MHEESGLKKEEMVGFWHEVFSLIKQAKPDMRLDLRAKDLPDEVIDDALKQGLAARVSTKFWMEQMGLPFHPTHINQQNQKDRRHGYADLLRYPQRYRVHWQLWSGGTTRLLLWGDPGYVRRFAGAARLYGGDSFEVNEMLATKMLGEPHGDSPVDILAPAARYYGTNSSGTGTSFSSGAGSPITLIRHRASGRKSSRSGSAHKPVHT